VTRVRAAALLLALLVAGTAARSQDIIAGARADSSDYLVGDWITVHVSFAHPKGTTFQSASGDTLGGFSLIQQLPFRPSGETRTNVDFIFSRYDSGSATLPPLKFLCTVPGDTVLRSVATNPLTLTVRTVPVDTTQEIKDLKPLMTLPYTWEEILRVLGGLIVALAVTLLAYLLYRSGGKTTVQEAYVAPARPAHVVALEELGALKARRLWQGGRIKQYYTEVTEILRRYFEGRYNVMALEETTEEIMSGLQQVQMKGQILQDTEKILRRADLVKFAKYQPGIPEHEETLTVAYAVVEMTKPRPATAAQESQGKVPAHVA
jgi:hypothetical protein